MPNETQVFIVRLWKERRDTEENAAKWRGSVERVPTGERKFVNAVAQIGRVIETYLEQSETGEEGRE